MENVYEIMKQRRSIRKYKSDPISGLALENILAAGRFAPSGANRQPWLFVTVDDLVLKKEIRVQSEEVDAIWNAKKGEGFRQWLKNQDIVEDSKPFLEEAPILLVVFADTEQPYWFESTWIAIAYMLLAVENEGLGTLTYTPGYPEFLNELLNVPLKYRPQVILPFGFPNEIPDPGSRKRKSLEQVVYRNYYRD